MQKCSLMTCVIWKLLVWSWGALCAKRHASALLKSAPGGITSTVFSTIQKPPHNAYITKIASAAIQLLPCLTVLWALITLPAAPQPQQSGHISAAPECPAAFAGCGPRTLLAVATVATLTGLPGAGAAQHHLEDRIIEIFMVILTLRPGQE